jgi:hypothetical protein
MFFYVQHGSQAVPIPAEEDTAMMSSAPSTYSKGGVCGGEKSTEQKKKKYPEYSGGGGPARFIRACTVHSRIKATIRRWFIFNLECTTVSNNEWEKGTYSA